MLPNTEVIEQIEQSLQSFGWQHPSFYFEARHSVEQDKVSQIKVTRLLAFNALHEFGKCTWVAGERI